MGNKRFKDPIYGYIEIEESLITQVVDLAEFQRLRDIIQTSYSPLYSSALHNRFVHSIGVHHLGRIAAEAFRKSITVRSLEIPEMIDQYIETFGLACLLHDVGHAPFSHTGEQFYLYKGDRTRLHKMMADLTGDADLEEEIRNEAYKAAPHELVSAIVALQVFGNMISDDLKSFFARCITGYKYTKCMNIDKSCKNCLIELLNSKVIDVDKMDYLIRDSYVTGFDTVAIDYMRLLKSIYVEEEQGEYNICFDKSAVSVIENVVYAHDAERKWIQNHPIVLYEAYLLENIMRRLIEEVFQTENLPIESLLKEGITVERLGRVRLIGDSDIRYLMKNLQDDSFVDEYYCRKQRKHPLWKTEAEFQAIFQGEEKKLEFIEKELSELKKCLTSLGLPFIINRQALNAVLEETKKIEKSISNADDKERKRLEGTLRANQTHIKWINVFESFAEQNKEELDFEFLILYVDQFNSGFRKQEFENLEIIFPELRKPCRFREVTNVLKAEKSKGEKYFYIFYNRKKAKETLSIAGLIDSLLTLSTNASVERRLV